MNKNHLCKPSQDLCLILTQSWQPFGVTTAKEGIKKLMRGSFRKKANIKAVDKNGNAHKFDDWIDKADYFDDQPMLAGVSRNYPVPTVLITNSLYFYKPRVRNVSIKILYKHFNGKCQICGKVKDIKLMSKEHILPKSKGGTNAPDNLTLTCKTCNAKKADIFPYLTSDGKELKSVSSYNPTTKINREEWRFFVKN